MKYELSKEQVTGLLAIISNADIKGKDAPVILSLAQALQNPVKEEKKKEKEVKK